MRGRLGASPGVIACCILGAMVLLTSCTASSGGSAGRSVSSAASSAGIGALGCQSAGVTGFATSPGLGPGSQLVLGRISVSTSYSQLPVSVAGNGPWRYWQKRGILIWAGTGTVVVSVPLPWRHQVAITYGTYGIVSSLVLTVCQQPSDVWDGFAGGIYLRNAVACVPLIFTIGKRSVTVRFSVAGRCS
jgi:hypothetical protein